MHTWNTDWRQEYSACTFFQRIDRLIRRNTNTPFKKVVIASRYTALEHYSIFSKTIGGCSAKFQFDFLSSFSIV